MSYDVYLEAVRPTVVWEGNHTVNCAPMWRKAGIELRELDGKQARNILPVLERAVKHMMDNPTQYLPLNPPNGWGDYHSAFRFLADFCDNARANPDAYIKVSS